MRSMSLGSIIKGWVGEVQGTLAKKIFLDSQIYIDLNNVTIPTTNGTTQIDHVIVSRYGIFVVETKNMQGWIFGSEKSPQWTQSIFGKSINSRIHCIKTIATPRHYLNSSASIMRSLFRSLCSGASVNLKRPFRQMS
jgi:hypothetical protein